MALRYRVSLAGLKGFARVYDLKPTTTLYEFHKLLRSELEFPQDQLIQFKALDADGGLVARFGLFDLGAGAVDTVTFKQTVAKGIASFVYFYDVANRKSVIITYEGEVADVPGALYPLLVETKGPVPAEFENGYVAYEDLPDDQKHLRNLKAASDDDDFDDDDDDDDDDLDDDDDDADGHDEDGEELYDEDEGAL
ncbi:MAG: hypothetical protein SPL35_03140 [Bacteroidales bacterium]|nr:hypothetical protein [Bacteroidales bacterium]